MRNKVRNVKDGGKGVKKDTKVLTRTRMFWVALDSAEDRGDTS